MRSSQSMKGKLKRLFQTGLLVSLLGLSVVFLWFFRYRFMLLVSIQPGPGMASNGIEGYTDRLFYSIGDTVHFYLKSAGADNLLILKRLVAPDLYEPVWTSRFPRIGQALSTSQSEYGCNWNRTASMVIDSSFVPGYYGVKLRDRSDSNEFEFCIIIGDTSNIAPIVILAPVGTWVAYNQWGGKSLYSNAVDSSNVYFVSTRRPNTAFQELHALQVEANIYNWFSQHRRVSILPDYILEQAPHLLQNTSMLVLAYHCEYVSEAMYDNLVNLVEHEGKSLISLGGNQIYWKTKWHKNFTLMECHKDLTFFEDTFDLGGMWRHNFRSEDRLLGVRYNNKGLHTYAPYEVLVPDHWLFEGTRVRKGMLFGQHGISELPISGDETDKVTFFSRSDVEIIAKGRNVKSVSQGAIYQKNKSQWNGEGGGELVLKELSPVHAVLSTGSIQSGSGLGVDSVFTSVIENFVERYLERGRNF